VNFSFSFLLSSPPPLSPHTHIQFLCPTIFGRTSLPTRYVLIYSSFVDLVLIPGVCFGTGKATDCSGECEGIAQLDSCGICFGGTTTIASDSTLDCLGICSGTAVIDDCGECVLGDSGLEPGGLKDCRGVCNGDAYITVCGDCFDPATITAGRISPSTYPFYNEQPRSTPSIRPSRLVSRFPLHISVYS
jgi:hypothetical protein